MVDYKKQHFVPKHYLQYFSYDYDKKKKDGHIWTYDIESKNIDMSTVKNIAQKDYCYDCDGKFEQFFLTPIDDKTSKVIQKIVVNKNFANFSKTTHETILKFLILQSIRTEASKEIVKTFADGSSKEKYPDLADIKNSEEFEKLRFQYYIKDILVATVCISDLKPFLVINSTSIPFVTSDYPVVLNNYFHSNMSVRGFETPGLQIICPISDKLCLFLIHDELYEIISNGRQKIEVAQDSDVDLINCLQIINCHKFIFFSDNSSLANIQRSSERAVQLKKDFIEPQIRKSYDDIKERVYPVNFSFLKARQGIDLTQYERNSDNPRLPIRNRDLHKNALELVKNIEAEYGEKVRELLECEMLLESAAQPHQEKF